MVHVDKKIGLGSNYIITDRFPQDTMLGSFEANSIHKVIKGVLVHEERQKSLGFGESCSHGPRRHTVHPEYE